MTMIIAVASGDGMIKAAYSCVPLKVGSEGLRATRRGCSTVAASQSLGRAGCVPCLHGVCLGSCPQSLLQAPGCCRGAKTTWVGHSPVAAAPPLRPPCCWHQCHPTTMSCSSLTACQSPIYSCLKSLCSSSGLEKDKRKIVPEGG